MAFGSGFARQKRDRNVFAELFSKSDPPEVFFE